MKCFVCKKRMNSPQTRIIVHSTDNEIMGIKLDVKENDQKRTRSLPAHHECSKHYEVAKKLMISAGVVKLQGSKGYPPSYYERETKS